MSNNSPTSRCRGRSLRRTPELSVTSQAIFHLTTVRHWRTIVAMKFIETTIFTKQITELLPDTDYRLLQSALLLRPDAGAVIKGSGGIRKIRWKLPNAGKRGSLRIIYYFENPETIYMLFAYKKNKQEDLTNEQVKIIKRLVKENLS